jgi:hypothetical protein
VFHDSLNQKQVGVVWNKKGTAFESFFIKRGIPTVHSLDILNYQYDDFGFIAIEFYSNDNIGDYLKIIEF